MAMTKITADTMVQRSIPDSHRGRAFAVYDIGYNGVFVLAALIPTLLIDATGPVGIVLVAGGLGVLAAGLFALASRRLPVSRDTWEPDDPGSRTQDPG
jgi:MFS family permease